MIKICLLPSSSFRRRPESSGLLHTFPPGGNDHSRVIPANVTDEICLTSRPAFLDSGLRRAATGVLGGSFPTPLYHLHPVGVPSRRIQDFLGGLFQTPLYHLHPYRHVHK